MGGHIQVYERPAHARLQPAPLQSSTPSGRADAYCLPPPATAFRALSPSYATPRRPPACALASSKPHANARCRGPLAHADHPPCARTPLVRSCARARVKHTTRRLFGDRSLRAALRPPFQVAHGRRGMVAYLQPDLFARAPGPIRGCSFARCSGRSRELPWTFGTCSVRCSW